MKCKPYDSDDFTLSNANDPAVAYAYTNNTTDFHRAISGEEVKDTVENAHNQFALLQPDDDLRRAITIDEVRDNIVEYIRKKHANKKNESICYARSH